MDPGISAQTPLGLAILGLLAEHPMHPYEIKQTIRNRRLDEHVKVKGGSLYHTVDRLVRAGLVEPLETERQGRRPERTVYRITEAGKDHLSEWIDGSLSRVQHEYPRFGAALAFMHNRGPETAATMLWQRAVWLEGDIAAHERVRAHLAQGEIPRAYLVEDEYSLMMRRAELAWLRSLIDDIRSGALTWVPHLKNDPTAEADEEVNP
ncbi:MAG TPA: PadR family transcriptional regulator [Candidatus Dormibacteraeota bacterium]|jgi:DNA-binding PadR family transcriptional regulator|nr:PadR family transcriptional regulator [Candidatus Dormibacteraeota bacterium]